MIQSAAEFVRLRSSEDPAEYHRAAHEEADVSVWLDVIDKYPDMRFWVAHNKTVPLEILELLASDPDVRVRSFVATKERSTLISCKNSPWTKTTPSGRSHPPPPSNHRAYRITA
ncbi:hypothetical protein AB4Y87_19790 [Paenarthrobacter sp. RAF54_2]|uniref:hypothetical protein n=1 Tax=Paenarthrobacter sp. RAF54_2 TaxID=3233061 RepID=UPI003F96BACC